MEAEVLAGIDAAAAEVEAVGVAPEEARDVRAVLGDGGLHALVPLDEGAEASAEGVEARRKVAAVANRANDFEDAKDVRGVSRGLRDHVLGGDDRVVVVVVVLVVRLARIAG